MATNILSIGQSALAAAQAGLSTTGHNIANAATPGYSRQTVVQNASTPQNFGYGFLGQGTEIATVKRIYSDFLGSQVRSTQTAKSGLDSYYAQLTQIDNMLADSSSGLSPVLQDFFKGVQDLAANPSSVPSRQAALSSAETLAARFQGLAGRFSELHEGVNSQISSSVGAINSYAKQIAQLNDAIEKTQSAANGNPPNDLLDQRDQLLMDLGKEIKTTVVKQDGGSYSVFIGSGQPLVVGVQTFALQTAASPTDPRRTEVAYATNGNAVILGEQSLNGGKLGGILEFRSQSLDAAQNALGRVAIGLASSFNAQHQLGQDLNGKLGGEFFTAATPRVIANSANTGNADISASISDARALTTSDYRLQYDGTDYKITRLTDGQSKTFSTLPQTIDGVAFSLKSGTAAAAGDDFLIRPTVNGAADFDVAIRDTSLIAAAAPIRTTAASTNTGSGKISAGSVDAAYLTTPPTTFTYSAGTPDVLNVSPATSVTVTSGGTSTVYSPGQSVVYTAGATVSFEGISFTLSGAPADTDKFTIDPNTGGTGDNRNALLLGALQTSNTLAGGTTNFQGAFAQLVSSVGNKTRELEVTSSAEGKLLEDAVRTQQAESGVNLDEEATNLLRYQQAYQAAGKVMQTASQMFDVLLSLGR